MEKRFTSKYTSTTLKSNQLILGKLFLLRMQRRILLTPLLRKHRLRMRFSTVRFCLTTQRFPERARRKAFSMNGIKIIDYTINIQGYEDFRNAEFHSYADFNETVFRGIAFFDNAKFFDDAIFTKSQFQTDKDKLTLDKASYYGKFFNSGIDIEDSSIPTGD